MDRELLIEIGCEELPASWLPPLTRQLGELLSAQLAEARLVHPASPECFSTPRRLTVRVTELAGRQTDLEETVTGPPVRAAFDGNGQPTPAALGFARKQGVTVGRLTKVETPKGQYLAFRKRQKGASSRSVLGGVLAATLRRLAFPKQMNWDARLDDGRGDLLFGRPIRWLLFLYGGRVVPFVIDRTTEAEARGVAEVRARAKTYGHRFFAREGKPGRPLSVRSFDEYQTALKQQYVLLQRADRQARIDEQLGTKAKQLGGVVGVVSGESSLLDEVPDLIEYPSVVAGHFPTEFLTLPDEVLKTTMIHHQHYFPVVTEEGRLTEHFLAVTNTPGTSASAIAHNSERVLIARLRDARFFWEADRSAPLNSRLDRLDTLLFHAKLGSYLAKTGRLEQLAGALARDVLEDGGQADNAARAGRLAKADLTTDMVGEFPELQGVMGGIYAREDDEPEAVWRAIYHHYLPIGILPDAPPQSGDLGAAGACWAAVSLADKLDTLVGLFRIGEKPTGSRDPFGLRRQAHGIFRILVDLPELTGLTARPDLGSLLRLAEECHSGEALPDTNDRLVLFLFERLRYVLEQRGHDVRNVRAVTHQPSPDDVRPLDALRKLEVLPEFAGSADFLQLARLFKRVRNIAKELSSGEFDAVVQGRTPVSSDDEQLAERQLRDELDHRGPKIEQAVSAGDGFRGAFAEAAQFGPAVDKFFTDVLVMADDVGIRRRRLALMRRLEMLILKLADVSEIVAE